MKTEVNMLELNGIPLCQHVPIYWPETTICDPNKILFFCVFYPGTVSSSQTRSQLDFFELPKDDK